MIKYYIYKFGQFVVNRLHPKLTNAIAIFLSDLQYFFSFRDREAVRNNLNIILGNPKNINTLTKNVFRNFGVYLVEFFQMVNSVDKKYINEKIKIKGIEKIENVLKQKKGGIILTAHIGNWELGGVILSLMGFPFKAVALPHKERPVNDLFNTQRESKGVKVIPMNKAVFECMRALKNNELIAILGDRDFSETGEVMDFLGKKALIPKGAATFSVKTGAGIIPMFLLREDQGSFVLEVENPIFPNETLGQENDKKAVSDLMKKYVPIIERKIKKNPTQWLMFRKFWIN